MLQLPGQGAGVPAPATNWGVQPLFFITAAAAMLGSGIPVEIRTYIKLSTHEHAHTQKKEV